MFQPPNLLPLDSCLRAAALETTLGALLRELGRLLRELGLLEKWCALSQSWKPPRSLQTLRKSLGENLKELRGHR